MPEARGRLGGRMADTSRRGSERDMCVWWVGGEYRFMEGSPGVCGLVHADWSPLLRAGCVCVYVCEGEGKGRAVLGKTTLCCGEGRHCSWHHCPETTAVMGDPNVSWHPSPRRLMIDRRNIDSQPPPRGVPAGQPTSGTNKAAVVFSFVHRADTTSPGVIHWVHLHLLCGAARPLPVVPQNLRRQSSGVAGVLHGDATMGL